MDLVMSDKGTFQILWNISSLFLKKKIGFGNTVYMAFSNNFFLQNYEHVKEKSIIFLSLDFLIKVIWKVLLRTYIFKGPSFFSISTNKNKTPRKRDQDKKPMKKCSVLLGQEKCVLKLSQDAAMPERQKCKMLVAWNAAEDVEQFELSYRLCECKWKSQAK